MDILSLTGMINFLGPAIWALLFVIGYTWTTKVDDVDFVMAAHVNLLQSEKLDRDGQIPATGAMQWDKGADVASAATLALGNDGNYFDVTGTTTITAITQTAVGGAAVQAGTVIKLHFDGILKIVHDGNNIVLPDGLDIYTQAEDELTFVCYASGKWRCVGLAKPRVALQNLITNSGFGVWSNSDTNKGLGTMNYDGGSGTAPVVGETMTGATSAATGKVIYYTITSGAFGTNDAAGVMYLGACTGRFNDNEQVNGGTGGGHVHVNHPNTGVGVDLVQNGEFESATTGWSAFQSTLASIAGGVVGNCLEITRTAGAVQAAYQDIAGLTVGKIYKCTVYVKSGTSGNEAFIIVMGGANQNGSVSGTSSGVWTAYSFFFEYTDSGLVPNRLYFEKYSATAGTMLFDEVTLYEITPCCTAADALAMDTWKKDTTLDIYRQHNDGGTLTKDGSFYSLKMVVTTAADFVYWDSGGRGALEEFYQLFAGRLVTFGAWVKTSTASHAKLTITDSAGSTSSAYHSGGGSWEWLEVTRTINAAPTSLYFYIYGDVAGNVNGNTIIYASQPMLVFGSVLGEGNYQPIINEIIWLETTITSNTLHEKLGCSDTAPTAVNLEADVSAKLPKGTKSFFVFVACNDSGSAAAPFLDLWLRASAISYLQFIISIGGLANDAIFYTSGWQPCGSTGDFDYYIKASGAATFDIIHFRYEGVMV